MPAPYPPNLTLLLNRMFQGDQSAGNEAMDALYTSLRRIASSKMRHERPGHLLDTTALVNEALARLFGSKAINLHNRQHFFALAGLLMRRILIDAGRREHPIFTSLEESMAMIDTPERELVITIGRILDRFAQLDPPAYKALQLKIGAGMTSEEIAAELSCSVGTVNRSLKRAKLWMFKEMNSLVSPVRES